MNPAHWHLILTHAPVFGTLCALLFLLTGIFQKNEALKRIGFWLLVFTAVLVLPTYLTGSPASTYMKRIMPTKPMDVADQHEEIAILALVAVLFTGVLSLTGLIIFKKGKALAGWMVGLVLVLSLISVAALGWTANLGGKISHTEIRAVDPYSGTPEH